MAKDYGMGEGGGPASLTLERFERVMMEATMVDLMLSTRIWSQRRLQTSNHDMMKESNCDRLHDRLRQAATKATGCTTGCKRLSRNITLLIVGEAGGTSVALYIDAYMLLFIDISFDSGLFLIERWPFVSAT